MSMKQMNIQTYLTKRIKTTQTKTQRNEEVFSKYTTITSQFNKSRTCRGNELYKLLQLYYPNTYCDTGDKMYFTITDKINELFTPYKHSEVNNARIVFKSKNRNNEVNNALLVLNDNSLTNVIRSYLHYSY